MKLFFSVIKKYDFNPLHVSWWKQTLVAILYYVTALLSISFAAYPNTGSTPIWIPGGIAVGLLFIWGYSLWLGVFIGVFIAEFTIYQGWASLSNLLLILLLTIITTLGKIIATLWSESRNNTNPDELGSRYFLYSAKNTVRFIVFGSFVSHIPIGIICASLVCLFGNASWNLFPAIAITWWLSDSFGILILTPLIVAWQQQINMFLKLIKRQWLEVAIIVTLTLLFNQTIYTNYHLEYLFIPLLVWTVFRFHELGASLIVLIITILLVIYTVQGNTSFVRESTRDSLLLLQSFVACISMTNLILSAALNENFYAKKELVKFNQLLLIKNSQLEELNHQKELQTQAKEKILLDYNNILEKQLSLKKAKEEAEKLTQQKNQFLASLGDEFLNPMNGVLGITEMLANTELTEEQNQYIQTIRNTGKTLLKVVNDILDFSSLEAGEIRLQEEQFNLEEMVKSVFILFVREAEEKQVKFSFSIVDNIPNLWGDLLRIRQILFNILSNSFKDKKQGSIIIQVKPNNFVNFEDDLGKKTVSLLFAIYNSDKIINTINTQKSELSKINFKTQPLFMIDPAKNELLEMEHYQQVNEKLGLLIAQRLINAIGGSMWIENKGVITGNPPSKWCYSSQSFECSTIYFTLDLLPNLSQSIVNKEDNSYPQIILKFKIFLVNYNRINQQLMLFFLKQLGYEATILDDYQETDHVLNEEKFNVVFIDINQEESETLSIVKTVRRISTYQLFLVASHHYIADRQDYYQSLGFDYCLSKPLQLNDITAIIKDVEEKVIME